MSLRIAMSLGFTAAITVVSAQILNLSTTSSGGYLYLVTTLRQRGSAQPATNKILRFRDNALTLVEQSPGTGGFSTYGYDRVALSATGEVWAINRTLNCSGGSSCLFRELATTDIQTSTGMLSFPGKTSLSRNGRYAAVYGNTNQAPGATPPAHTVRLVDLATGQVALLGPQAAQDGQMVADDGTVLVGRDGGIRLVGPAKSIDLSPARHMNRALLSADASHIVYDVQEAPDEIRVIDVDSGLDRSLAQGRLPMLVDDGRIVSYLNPTTGPVQIWLGDTVTGSTRALSNEPENILDQTISGNGSTVFASTNTGRMLSISTSTGVVTQLLGSLGASAGLLAAVVPGSYNEITGTFPAGVTPDVRVGITPVFILGPSPRGFAIQIPWEVQPNAQTEIVLSSSEPAWEYLLRVGVFVSAGAALPVGAGGPEGPAYYAVHQDWSAFVSHENPAKPGEVIHMYGTGYGPVDGTLPTGQATPADRPYRMDSPCTWRALGVLNQPRSFDVLFAGLAPGLVGIYQFDFRIPPDWPYLLFNPYCQLPDNFLPTAAIEVQP